MLPGLQIALPAGQRLPAGGLLGVQSRVAFLVLLRRLLDGSDGAADRLLPRQQSAALDRRRLLPVANADPGEGESKADGQAPKDVEQERAMQEKGEHQGQGKR